MQLSSRVDVLVGDYGTEQDTTIVAFTQGAKYLGRVGELGVRIPYLFRDGRGATPGEAAVATTRTIPEEADGIGDVWLTGEYYWLKETDARPKVNLTGRFKVPTASDGKGLGTGRPDVGFGAELKKHFSKVIGLLDGEVLVRDRPSGSSLNAVRFNYAAGLGYPLTKRLTSYLLLDGSTKSSRNRDAPLALVWSNAYQATKAVSLSGQLLVGLTDGSPDFGVGSGVTVRF